MTSDWPTTLVGYLRAHGLPAAYSEPSGAIHGLGELRAVAIDLGSAQAAYADMELMASALDGAPGFVVLQPRPDAPVAASYAVMSLSGLVALVLGEAPAGRPSQERMPAPEEQQGTDHALTVLAATVAALTSGGDGWPLAVADVVAGADPLDVITALTVFALSAMRAMLPPEATAAVLARLGLIAAGGDVQ